MAAARADCTVLLIDDEQAGLQLRKLVLESAGFKSLTASNSADALGLFCLHDVDVVVTDHLLGRATAATLALAMRRLKPQVPIVSLSGTTNHEEALKYADGFIGKAEGPEVLISTLDHVLARNAPGCGPILAPQPSVLCPEAPAALPSQAFLAAIVEDSSDAILSKTLDGIITSWNHSAEVMYGYSREDAIGKPISMLLPPDRPDEVSHILSRLRRGERIIHFETIRVAKDGHKLEVSLTISPIRDGDGRLVGASTIARDITEKKQVEEALRKAEKLALAGRVAATVAHEINNPLEAIGNILYLLRNVVELNDDARKYVDTASEELKRVAEITRLTLGMQRSGPDRYEPVRLTEILESVLALYQRKTSTLGVEVQRRYDFDGEVVGSPGELRQVFSNLVINAMDALATSGDKIILHVRLVPSSTTGVRGVRVSVSDNGPGIDPRHRSQLFQAFHTTKGEQGTGIGLWVSKAIVKKHGGTLRMHSSVRPGRSGTCFSVFLPLENQDQMSRVA